MTPQTLTRITLFLLLGLILYWVQLPRPEQTEFPQPESQVPVAEDAGPIQQETGAPVRTVAEAPRDSLPQAIRPLGYRLDLTIDPDHDYAEGRVEIDIEAPEEIRLVKLHGRGLEVRHVFVRDAEGRDLPASYRETGEGRAEVMFATPLMTNAATLVFDYRVAFAERPEGLYRFEADGRRYAVTQFEPIAARLAFPGFDEPRFKTPFTLILTVPEGLEAVSNMPLLSTEKSEGEGVRMRFATTPPLPTYLLAFAVGPFDIREGEPIAINDIRDGPVALRGVAAAGRADRLAFALAETDDLLAAFEHYFALPYPYPKLDLIAVPRFAASAMENPGAIVYHESVLTVDEASPLDVRRRFYEVHAHELAHQWFGNLVTPMGWSDIWLNEAFATWLGRKILHRQKPGFGFIRATQRQALAQMERDSRQGARPVYLPVESNADIATAFDPLVYHKGAALLAMFEHYLGPEIFRAAVRTHMERHENANADTAAFLRSLATAAGDEAVTTAMWSFLRQPGVPVVDVAANCPPGGGVNVTLGQKRYVPLGGTDKDATQWEVPVCLRLLGQAGEDERRCLMLGRPSQTFYARKSICPDAIIPDADGAGYYRWALDEGAWASLAARFDRLTVSEALSYADNLSVALRTGGLDLEAYLGLVRPVAGHDAWDVASAPLGDLQFLLERVAADDAAARAGLVQWTRALYDPRLATLLGTVDREDENARLLRRRLLAFYLLGLEDDRVAADLAERGHDLVDSLERGNRHALMAAEDGDLALVAAVRDDNAMGGRLAKGLGALPPAERAIVIRALSWSGRGAVADDLLARITGGELAVAEALATLSGLMETQATQDQAGQWLGDNFDRLAARVPQWRQSELAGLMGHFCTPEDRKAVEEAFRDRVEGIGGGHRALDSALEAIDVCIALKSALRPQTIARFGKAPPAPAGAPEPAETPL